jgi:hypothetical protein
LPAFQTSTGLPYARVSPQCPDCVTRTDYSV